jgi:hypothetical protein
MRGFGEGGNWPRDVKPILTLNLYFLKQQCQTFRPRKQQFYYICQISWQEIQ